MGWTPPGRLFHAVVLAGAAMGASCRRAALTDNANSNGMKDGGRQLSDSRAADGGGTSDLRLDLRGQSDAPTFDVSFDIVFGPGPDGAAPPDAGSDEPRDAGCDVDCGPNAIPVANCTCAIVIA